MGKQAECPDDQLGVIRAAIDWWREQRGNTGFVASLGAFFQKLLEFVHDSLPERKRQRYGDVDYDWDHPVDTTSATVAWRERLLGQFLSPYQATDPDLFREMLSSLDIDFRQFTFVDIGSGKGRVLLMASDYPFRRILGIERLPALHRIALGNIGKYRSDFQKCLDLQSICADAADYTLPREPLVLYLFNPLPEYALRRLMAKLAASLEENPRAVRVLYHNPLLEHVLQETTGRVLKKIGGTEQYLVYSSLQ